MNAVTVIHGRFIWKIKIFGWRHRIFHPINTEVEYCIPSVSERICFRIINVSTNFCFFTNDLSSGYQYSYSFYIENY